MPGPKSERCGDCYFCGSQTGLNINSSKLCFRLPPEVQILPVGPGQVNISGHWPPVLIDSWCGEWKPKLMIEKDTQNTPRAKPEEKENG